jgi:hypothetical protein
MQGWMDAKSEEYLWVSGGIPFNSLVLYGWMEHSREATKASTTRATE